MGDKRHEQQQQQGLWRAAERIVGRLEVEIEYQARARAIEPMALGWAVVAILSDAWERTDDRLPVRIQASEGSAGAPALEGAVEPHGGRAQHSTGRGTSKTSKTRKTGIGGYWAGMTPEQRKAEMSRRYKLRGKPTPTAQKKRVLTPEAREAIVAAQKRRWAKHHSSKKAA